MELTGNDDALRRPYDQIVVLFNATDEPVVFTDATFVDADLALHPIQQTGHDPVVKTTAFAAAEGQFTVPARTTAVFVHQGKSTLYLPLVFRNATATAGALRSR